MEIEKLVKKQNVWEFGLKSEGHSLANLVRELSWKFRGEAAYQVDHPLTGHPVVRVVADNPKIVLTKVSSEIVKLSRKVEKAFK